MSLLTPSARSGKAKHHFTYDEDVVIVSMTKEGFPASAIAQKLGTHSELSVRYRQQWHRKASTPATLEDLAAYHKAQANKRNKTVAQKPGAMVQPNAEADAVESIVEEEDGK